MLRLCMKGHTEFVDVLNKLRVSRVSAAAQLTVHGQYLVLLVWVMVEYVLSKTGSVFEDGLSPGTLDIGYL